MTCLQCPLEAVETNELVGKAKVRLCSDGHRTALATKSMIRKSEQYHKWAGKAKSGVLEYTPTKVQPWMMDDGETKEEAQAIAEDEPLRFA